MGNKNTNNELDLKFSRSELKILYRNFIKLDKDASGEIEPNEFFDIEELQDNPIVNRIIKIFDKNNDGKISFFEFVIGLSSFTYYEDEDEKLKMVFKIYDLNNDGYISNGEIFKTIQMLVGDNMEDVQIQQVVDRTMIEADQDGDGLINFDEFCAFVKNLNVKEMFTMELFK